MALGILDAVEGCEQTTRENIKERIDGINIEYAVVGEQSNRCANALRLGDFDAELNINFSFWIADGEGRRDIEGDVQYDCLCGRHFDLAQEMNEIKSVYTSELVEILRFTKIAGNTFGTLW